MPQTAAEQLKIIERSIRRGTFDEYLDDIIDAAVRRKRQARMTHGLQILAELEVGDTIRIGAVKPKLLSNRHAEVRKIDITRDKVTIRLLGHANLKWRADRDITLPVSAIAEIVKKASDEYAEALGEK